MALTNREHALEDGWKLSIIDTLSGGERFDVESDLIAESECTLARNVLFEKGRVESDKGYTQFADDNIWGNPRKEYKFVHGDGVVDTMLITNESVFKFNSTHDAWHAVKGLVDTTTSQSEIAGAISVTVASTTGFVVGNHMTVILDNGAQHKTNVVSISGSVIEMLNVIPSGRTVANGAAVEEPIILVGTDDKPVDVITWQKTDLMIFVNGVDKVQQYNKTAVIVVPNLPSSGNTIARTIAVYNDYVMLGFTTEGGTARPYRVRRCDTGDPTNWTTGNAGFDDLVNDTSDIQFMNVIGPYIIVYRDRSIVRGELVAADDKLFDFDTVVAQDGLVGPEGVASIGDADIFIGHKTIWKYEGGTELEDVGGNIFEKIFGLLGDLNTEFRHRIRAIYVEELGEAWFIYPISGENFAIRLRRFKVRTNAWASRDFADSITAVGVHQRGSTLTWNDGVGSWAAQSTFWDSRAALKDAPTIILGLDKANEDQRITEAGDIRVLEDDATIRITENNYPLTVEYDYLQSQDISFGANDDISVELRTKNFSAIDRTLRFDRFHFFTKGQTITVDYSKDNGVTWITLGTLPASTSYTRKTIHKQFVTENLMLRWTGTGADFGLGWFSMVNREENVIGGS